MKARRTRAASRAGFTLLELMGSLIIGVITITVAYSLSTTTSRVLSEQQRLAQTQTAVRLAMEQIRADIERAGLFGTPNSNSEHTCITPSARFQALAYEYDEYTGAIPNAAAHDVHGDGLILMGNYLTSGSYLVSNLDATGSTLNLQPSWQAFRRDFGVPTSQDAYDRIFAEGTWLHLETEQRRHFFVKVTSNSLVGSVPTVAIDTPLPVGGACIPGLADGSSVAPLVSIEYAVVDPRTDPELATLVGLATGETQAERDLIDGQPSVLVRREVDPTTQLVIPNTTRVVLEWVVEFSLSFDIDTTSGPDSPPTMTQVEAASAQAVLGITGSAPQQVRAVTVRLSARTTEADVRIPWIARAPGAPLTRYYARNAALAPGLPSSRVRTLTSTVFVPNVAYSDMN